MKIFKVELIEDAPIYKGIIGAIINKDVRCFYVKTQDSFIKIIDYEYDEKINIGDRFEI
jgi:methionyl-tRNA formyltransferase